MASKIESVQSVLAERHEAEVDADGKRDIKYVFAFKNLDWEAYHRFRPVYPESMWKQWFDYHRNHGGAFEIAHDAGCGPGTAATAIGPHFKMVFVSDAGASNLATAEASLKPREKFTFHRIPAEKTAEWLSPASVDFTSICMAFHYMESAATVRAVAQTLKPGGTFAAVTYGFRLLFPGQLRAEELWYKTTSRATLRLMSEGKLFPAATRGLARAMTGLDFVAFPSNLFEEGVRRTYINVTKDEKRPLYFVDNDPSLWEEAPTFVSPTDVLEYVQDAAWGRRADVAWLRGFLASSQMGFDEKTWASEEWKELEAIVCSGPNGTIEVEWPVAMTLATRKKEA
ncbi:hypothetical protein SPBR_04320 [Sporothrix brasiliensis 5110]|uniref:Methyltransferase type 11 domain-containing protein n=1 Tax=Sporothrix brasiliensis 5110 TaxID=1398154 RepID=A0A0C2JA41_9PEZI|nr:uncharacterized protein SPBR_04320 [Sporothrix brasiliensis 5110]KIH93797.1 hypothetical protein SPBR_04320 [Sporothrix brasiliensis 5110]